jgi:Lon protease-like protein
VADLLPIFPLPNVVLFPHVFLALHIFEPRYRAMVADALEGDRMIGMVLLRPGWEGAYDGRPPIYPIGCSGVITHVEQLDDGRYNIVLRGVERFRVVEEDDHRSYRRAVVEPLAERRLDADDRAAVRAQRAKLEALLSPGRSDPSCGSEAPAGPVIAAKAMAAMGDEELVNALAQYLGLDPLERQALLEHGSLRSRAESLVELLEMKIIVARTPGLSGVAH